MLKKITKDKKFNRVNIHRQNINSAKNRSCYNPSVEYLQLLIYRILVFPLSVQEIISHVQFEMKGLNFQFLEIGRKKYCNL